VGDLQRQLGKMVSGGQTGADRAALDWAIRHGVAYGGWCPRGGLAEDLKMPPGLLADYPELVETPHAGFDDRTTWNVRDSDATLLVVLPGTRPSAGTAFTREEAVRLGRPHLLADGTDPEAVRRWLAGQPSGLTLNVAGPRESGSPGIYAAVTALLDALDASRPPGGGP
jgi:hypothetical protein